METFLLALGVLLAGGVFPLLTHRLFNFMKAVYIGATVCGCGIGLYAAGISLRSSEIVSISWPWLHIFMLSFSLDSLSAFFLIPIFSICPLAALYSFHYMNKGQQSGRTAINLFFFTVLIISMALVTTAGNIISFALAWEVMSVSSFFLVMYEYQREATRQAGYLYFIFAQAGAMFIFAAFAVAYSHTGSFSFAQFAGIPAQVKVLIFFLALIGFGSKAGIFPVHIWLPHAHPAAPSHISAVMSGVMIKMGIYGIIRIYSLLEVKDLIFGQSVLVFGMISGLLGIVYALGKRDIKKLLAYSSVENIGIILIGAGTGMIGVYSNNAIMAGFGFAGSLLHVLNHSIFKSLMFMGAGAILQKTKTRHIDQMGGLIKRMPLTGKSCVIGAVSISGLPPFNGFIGEFMIYFAAFEGLGVKGPTAILMMLAIISLALIGGLAVTCFTKVIGVAFLGEPRSDKAASASECGFAMTAPMVVMAAACVIIGIIPEPFINLVFLSLRDIHGFSAVPPDVIAGLARNLGLAARLILALLALSLILQRICYLGKEVAKGPTWGCGFTRPTARMQYTGTSYAMSVADFFRPFVKVNTVYSGIKKIFPRGTTYTTRVDDIAEITMNQGMVGPLLKVLGKLRWIQHGNIQLYFGYIILTIVVMLFFI
ncbi:MAG: proton-conducting transporter membrane subunit [Desulfocapsaceae bacterium]|nr:proton-conducting transporter membrane subunit [Desulfocapsaceae bacterium]